MISWFRRKLESAVDEAEPVQRRTSTSTHNSDGLQKDKLAIITRNLLSVVAQRLFDARPVPTVEGMAMDEMDSQGESSLKRGYQLEQPNVSDVLLMWYASQSFIGHQMCAILAQHVMIDRVCTIPARDAIRKGFKHTSADGEKLSPDIIKYLKAYDEYYNLDKKMLDYLRKGRIFGVRVAFFKITNPDPLYYEKPFNIDGVMPGSYKGIVMVDPYWCAPIVDGESAMDPASLEFYEPTYWMINGKKYHRTHLCIFRNSEVADILKPSYLYGGVPVPQRVMERIYNAERTANEGPLLAMTKRMTVYATDAAEALANKDKFDANLANWVEYRDNQQVKIIDKESESIVFSDTSLADLDAVIMTQYQLVAAEGGLPATKLLQTSPKGFGATGDYETENYHEDLESLQSHDLTPFCKRHHAIVMRSDICPRMGIAPIDIGVNWNPLDTPKALDLAQTNLAKAQTDVALEQTGAVDGVDIRNRLINDSESGYEGIAATERTGDTLTNDPSNTPATPPANDDSMSENGNQDRQAESA